MLKSKPHKTAAVAMVKRNIAKAVNGGLLTTLESRKKKGTDEYLRYPRQERKHNIMLLLMRYFEKMEWSDYNPVTKLKFGECRYAITLAMEDIAGLGEMAAQRTLNDLHECGILVRVKTGEEGVTVRAFAPEFFIAVRCDETIWFLKCKIKPAIEGTRAMRHLREMMANDNMASRAAPQQANAPPPEKRHKSPSLTKQQWLDKIKGAK